MGLLLASVVMMVTGIFKYYCITFFIRAGLIVLGYGLNILHLADKNFGYVLYDMAYGEIKNVAILIIVIDVIRGIFKTILKDANN